MRSELTFSECLFSPERVVLSILSPKLLIQHWLLTRYDSTSRGTLFKASLLVDTFQPTLEFTIMLQTLFLN
jgi:hypothetical protein